MTAGCLFQTVWNVVTNRPPTSGIKHCDIFDFDGTDISWGAEDAVIKAGQEVFAGLPAEVEIRNEARVHLWYEQKLGVPCPPRVHRGRNRLVRRDDALSGGAAGAWRGLARLAPHGFSDASLTTGPGPMSSPAPSDGSTNCPTQPDQ